MIGALGNFGRVKAEIHLCKYLQFFWWERNHDRQPNIKKNKKQSQGKDLGPVKRNSGIRNLGWGIHSSN
jgi:hypothetical protein